MPSNIGDALPNLQRLYLEDNMFNGHPPSSLGNSSWLDDIILANNNFSGQVPTSLGKLQKMFSLLLENNKIEANNRETWEFLSVLANCTLLQVLDLNDNQLQGAIPNSIGNLSASLLDLRGSSFSAH